MWCLVSQANSVILEVQVDPKAIGQECLEKNKTTLSVVYKRYENTLMKIEQNLKRRKRYTGVRAALWLSRNSCAQQMSRKYSFV
ncbi:E3 ubiquitin-protein ligase MYLIP isoform X2 [Vespula maculifrons]|uniref:E3 ubiquitin-protein ligase MYLIP isoform X2 n=1 Tax=Vespula maculifrons TaxID=7453 RepID=A0ABD2BIS0_VESMC